VFESGLAISANQVLAIGAVSFPLVLAGVYVVLRIRRQPKDREKRRRLTINLHGRLGDATITDVSGNTIFYEYSVRGVAYTTSQDISQLRDQIAMDPERLIGLPASLKYSPQNPANSILLCEDWSGLRVGSNQQAADAVS